MLRSLLAVTFLLGVQSARQNLGALLDEAQGSEAALRARAGASFEAKGDALEKTMRCKGCTRISVETVVRPHKNYWPVEPQGQEVINQLTNQISNTGSQLNSNANAIRTLAEGQASNAMTIQNNAQAIANLDSGISSAQAALTANRENIANAQDLVSQTITQAENMVLPTNQMASNAAARLANTQAIDGLEALNAANTNAINDVSGVLNNVASNTNAIAANAQRIASVDAVRAANSAALDTVSNTVQANANRLVTLTQQSDLNAQVIAELTPRVSMLAGSVAQNTAQLNSLSQTVGILNEAASPTVSLASALNVPISTISTMSLAGSFIGPAMGAMALVYVTWPPPKSDPWWNMESRVRQMIDDKFAEVRRERLGNRLKRYIRMFSRCSGQWISSALAGDPNHKEAASALQLSMHHATGGSLPREWNFGSDEPVMGDPLANEDAPSEEEEGTPAKHAAPPCMADLEGHMALERDEWMTSEEDSLDGLFMPFANMHTQIQVLLKDYPPLNNRYMEWKTQLESTAGEYAIFLISALTDGWKAQVCRSTRLRYTVKSAFWWKYFLTVLEPVWQPNAGEDCWDKCGGKSGWCAYCGGHKRGACCKKGAAQTNPPQDPSECLDFDPPVTSTFKKPYHACVSADCGQSNTDYVNVKTIVKVYVNGSDWTSCQDYCRTVPNAEFWTLRPASSTRAFKCKCHEKGTSRMYRVYRHGVISGPKECPHERDPENEKFQTEEAKEETPHIPMIERRPCTKSPTVRNLQELHEHTEWMNACFQNATKLITEQYNPFFKRFAHFIDRLASRAGCSVEEPEKEDWSEMSEELNFASFSECNWEREQQRKEDDVKWVPDREKRMGITGLSKIDFNEQRQLKMKYAMPAWLQRRVNLRKCLVKKFPGFAKERPGHGAEKEDVERIIADAVDGAIDLDNY